MFWEDARPGPRVWVETSDLMSPEGPPSAVQLPVQIWQIYLQCSWGKVEQGWDLSGLWPGAVVLSS